MKCRQFLGEAQHNPLPAFILVMLALLALVAMSSLLALLYLLIKDQVSLHSTLTPRFRLSYNFNNSRAGQNTCKKGKQKVIKHWMVRSLRTWFYLEDQTMRKFPARSTVMAYAKWPCCCSCYFFKGVGWDSFAWIFLFVIFLQAVSGWQWLGSDVGSLSFNGSFPSSGPDFIRLSAPKGL